MKNEDLLAELERTYAYLKEDLNSLEDLFEEYFISTKPLENFEFHYFKIQSMLITIIKAMKLNELKLNECINNAYK